MLRRYKGKSIFRKPRDRLSSKKNALKFGARRKGKHYYNLSHESTDIKISCISYR